jgi:hypothetical protein
VRRSLALAFVLAVLAWHGVGLWLRFGPMDAAAAAAGLRAGTWDRNDRRRALRTLCEVEPAGPRDRLLALAAAIALDDRPGYARLLAAAGPERALLAGEGATWPPTEAEARALADEAAFGEHWLRHFLLGQWLRAAGDPRAAAELDAAARGAARCEVALGRELAAAAGSTPPPAGR